VEQKNRHFGGFFVPLSKIPIQIPVILDTIKKAKRFEHLYY